MVNIHTNPIGNARYLPAEIAIEFTHMNQSRGARDLPAVNRIEKTENTANEIRLVEETATISLLNANDLSSCIETQHQTCIATEELSPAYEDCLINIVLTNERYL